MIFVYMNTKGQGILKAHRQETIQMRKAKRKQIYKFNVDSSIGLTIPQQFIQRPL